MYELLTIEIARLKTISKETSQSSCYETSSTRMKREAKESSTHSSKQNKSKHVRKSTLERRKQSLRRRFVEESQRIPLPAGIHEKRIIYQRKKLSLSFFAGMQRRRVSHDVRTSDFDKSRPIRDS